MPLDQRINESANVVLNAQGYGVARLGPGRAGLVWRITQAAVSINSAAITNVPQVRLYLGEPSPGNELTSSYNGARNATELDVILNSGQYLTAEWSLGDAGAPATLSLYGSRVGR